MFAILLFELRGVLARKSFLITTASLPVLGLLLLAAVRIVTAFASGDDDRASAGYVDSWGRLPDVLPVEWGLNVYNSEADAKADLLSGVIEAYYLIPEDYIETGTVYRNALTGAGLFTSNSHPALLGTLLTGALLEGSVDPQTMERVLDPVVLEVVRLDKSGNPVPSDSKPFARFIVPYVFAFMLMMSILMTSGFLVQSVAEEKQSRVIEVVLSSVSPVTLMAGKILGLGAAGLVQICIWLVSAVVIARLAGTVLPLPEGIAITVPPAMLIVGVLFFVLGYLFYATILAGVGSIVTSPQEGSQIGGFATFFAVIPLALTGIIVESPNGVLAIVLSYIPFTSPITMMLRLSSETIPWLDVAGGAVVLVISTAGGVFVSARLFRSFLLLYGRRPGIRELFRTLRQAS
jgi:ABC-2 type transport system permease protein